MTAVLPVRGTGCQVFRGEWNFNGSAVRVFDGSHPRNADFAVEFRRHRQGNR